MNTSSILYYHWNIFHFLYITEVGREMEKEEGYFSYVSS